MACVGPVTPVEFPLWDLVEEFSEQIVFQGGRDSTEGLHW